MNIDPIKILASVNVGLPSPISQYWDLWDYPENPYIVLLDYKDGETLFEKRVYLDNQQIHNDQNNLLGVYSCLETIDGLQCRDVEV